MKKTFLMYSLSAITFFGVLSCEQNEANDVDFSETQKENTIAHARDSNLTEEELISQLVQDEDFINFGNDLMKFYEAMPKKNNFSSNFESNIYEEEGILYLAEISGYTEMEIENKFNTIGSELEVLQSRYPQLVYDGTNIEFIDNVLNGVDEQMQTNGSACDNCIKIHRPRVIKATLIGASHGLFGGIRSIALHASIAFISAVNAAANCFEAAGGCGIGSTFSK